MYEYFLYFLKIFIRYRLILKSRYYLLMILKFLYNLIGYFFVGGVFFVFCYDYRVMWLDCGWIIWNEVLLGFRFLVFLYDFL